MTEGVGVANVIQGEITQNERPLDVPPGENDTLLKHLPETSPLSHVREALVKEGYCVLQSVLTSQECDNAIEKIWDFVEDTSCGRVVRSNPNTWYPKSETDEDPWPHTGYKSFSDMFQSNGAGFVLGNVRERLAERLFEPLYQTRQLHCSKEGFTFHRPTANNNNGPPTFWVENILSQKGPMVCGQPQYKSVGEHYDQSHSTNGLATIQSLVAFEDQEEDVDGCFLCYPGSHGLVHQEITEKTYRGQFVWNPLTDAELERLQEEFQMSPKRVYLKKGDVVLWRSDLVHAPMPPSAPTRRFRAVGYASMQPACLTPKHILTEKMNAYKQRQTGDHRPHVESWHSHRRPFGEHVPHYRTSPPLITIRLAELYGLIPYTDSQEQLDVEMERSVIRGVRFRCKDSFEIKVCRRPCPARLEFIDAKSINDIMGQDKYMGGMACGNYIYGVPGTAKRVLRVNTQTNEMDWIGPSFSGKFKWLRGVEVPATAMNSQTYPQGCCLALPCNAESILKINPETNEVYTFGSEVLNEAGASGWYYHGGNLASNGMVYAIPANANRVLKIDPRIDEVSYIGPDFTNKRQKWFGGIMGSDGLIYGIPHNETGVLQIDPETDSCNVLHNEDGQPLPPGRWKWHGGLAAGHKIYGFPNNASNILVINTWERRVYTIADKCLLESGRHRIPQDGRYKYLGGALTLDGRYLYLFPCDAERVMRVDTVTDDVSLVGPELLDGENKYQNGFVARDGCLYGIPQRATGILCISPPGIEGEEEHIDIMYCGDDMVGVKDKFEGAVMGMDGCIYCMPLRAKTCVKVIPGPAHSTCASSD